MIKELLENKTAKEKSQIKAREIAKLDFVGTHTRGDLEIQILELKAIEVNGQHGVELLAKAWDKGEQIGFLDGTVEIERFRIFNPRIEVFDGTLRTEEILNSKGILEQVSLRNYKEDLQEATLRTLERSIKVSIKDIPRGLIIKGRVGHTVSSFFTAIDRLVYRNGTDFADCRAGAGSNTTANATDWIGNFPDGTQLQRAIYSFDTSAIPDTDTVSAATFSVKRDGTAASDTSGQGEDLVLARAGITTTIVNSDYNIGNWTMTLQAPSKLISTMAVNADQDYAMNATGQANIVKTGYTVLGLVLTGDRTNTDIGTGPDGVKCLYSGTAGTDDDPILTVTHAAAAAAAANLMLLGVGT